MLNPHRQSVLTNACIKPSSDPINRMPGTIYEPKGQVRLLGLLSESASPQEDYVDGGDGILICMKRTKKKSASSTEKGCLEPEKLNVSDTSDKEPDSYPSRQQEVPGESMTPTSDPKTSSPSPSTDPSSQLRPGSFPFQWMWERFSIKGKAMYQHRSSGKVKKKISSSDARSYASEPLSTPEPNSGSATGQGSRNTKGNYCLPEYGTSRGPKEIHHKHQKRHQLRGPSPGSSLLPLYWKMEARSEARKRQLRQERRHWLKLAQQLLSLEDRSPWGEKRFSAKQLEEKLRAELLCLATEPMDPSCPNAQREKIRAMTAEEPTFKPTINRKIPNFKNLQKQFQEQLAQKKAKLTVCKPFRLASSGSSPTFPEDEDKQDEDDPFYEFYNLCRLDWRAQPCPDFGPSSAHPVMHTKTSDKRQEANRLLLQEWERREQQEKQRAEMRRIKEQQVQREVAKCLAAYRSEGHSAASVQKKREELRKQERQRMEEYSLQLQEMQDRVESRPYLFERVMQLRAEENDKDDQGLETKPYEEWLRDSGMFTLEKEKEEEEEESANARQAVQRRFSKVLAALGIDEEILWKHAVQQAARKRSSKAMHKRPQSPDDFSEQI